ncbi:YOR251C [Saccharomyces arboricola H-6]|uniref:Sulfurtransferase n=1 Tax=Saccharomyces arboricola (strain H-6 / AS 2.3317 / CBS 10644) TaxID=1160507 RepID=J8PW49_SACAR|nr:YOR251C [Saccharomyces arboricola H-6]
MLLFDLISPEVFVKLVASQKVHRVIPVDSTWYLPSWKLDNKQDFMTKPRIKNSVFFDIDAISDKNSPYPHMLPTKHVFDEAMSNLGILNDDILVVYDRVGNFSAPRCAWTLKVMGHPRVHLLNNFNEYQALDYPLDSTKVAVFSPFPMSRYESTKNLKDTEVVDYNEIFELVKSGELAKKYNVFDARSLGRFEGTEPEPRPDISSGHIPGSQPLPYDKLLDPKTKTYPEDKETIRAVVEKALKDLHCTLDPNKPTICTCGTGVSGAIIKTGLELAGVPNVSLYDGSWTEWVLKSDPKWIAKNND